jgi:hypothetical protein
MADLTVALMADHTVALMADHTVALMVDHTAGRMADLTVDRMVALADHTVGRITAIGSADGRAGFMAIATSGIACGIAGIRSATTVRAGTFAALTGSRRNTLAGGASPLAPLSRPNKYLPDGLWGTTLSDNPQLQQMALGTVKE